MFKIVPLTDISRQKEVCDDFGIKAKEGYFVYLMLDYHSDAPMGIAQFEISEGYGYINDLCEYKGLSDFEAMFILGRQTMNFIDKCGAHICYANPEGANPSLLKSIGFTENEDGKFSCDMSELFNGSCGGKCS